MTSRLTNVLPFPMMQKDSVCALPFLTSNVYRYEVANQDITTTFRTFKYRILLKKGQYKELARIAESQRQIYNAALQERIDCYSKTGKGRSYIDQCKAITELRKDSKFSNVPANMQRWTLKRLDDAYKGFFKRSGFPRFKGFHRWRAFGFAEFSGIRFDGKYIRFKGLNGSLRVHIHRPLRGEIKSCVFRKDLKGWFVCFQCAIPAVKIMHTGLEVGIDVGLNHFATLSNGEQIPNPRIARRAHAELRRRQRALARCKKGSNRRRKIKNRLARAHEKIRNTRKTFLHQQSAKLVKQYRTIVVEDLKIKNMVKNHHLARSISDAGWGEFVNMLTYKAESANGKVIKVNPRNTSQACSGCGQIVRKELKERVHSCNCGTVLDRDHNAAINILSRGGIVPWQPKMGGYAVSAAGNISVAG